MKYPKIQTLWKRDEKTHKIIEGEFSKQEFNNIKIWDVSEKVDGSNIRIQYENSNVTEPNVTVRFDGRDYNSQINTNLFAHLQKTFTKEAFIKVFEIKTKVNETETSVWPTKAILYGEGYGSGIQRGGLYRKDISFILFDVWVDSWWLERYNVADIASKLNIPVVPSFGVMSLEQAVNIVKYGNTSLCSEQPQVIEGIVGRSSPLMLFLDGTPIMFKLKVRDYN